MTIELKPEPTPTSSESFTGIAKGTTEQKPTEVKLNTEVKPEPVTESKVESTPKPAVVTEPEPKLEGEPEPTPVPAATVLPPEFVSLMQNMMTKIDQLEAKQNLTPVEDAPPEMQEFISEEDFNNIYTDRSVLNNAINKAMLAARESSLQAIPRVAEPLIRSISHLTNVTERFWDKNSDLLPYRSLIISSINQIEQTEPNLSAAQKMEKAGNMVRENLKGLLNTVTPTPTTAPPVTKGSSRMVKPSGQDGRSSMQKQLDSMNAATK